MAQLNNTITTAAEQKPLPWLLILVTTVVSLMAAIWPIAIWAIWIRPKFAVMVVIYWILISPFRIGLVYACCVGLLLDILEGSVLGQQALALTVVAYTTFLFNMRLRMISLLEQTLAVFVLVLVFLCIDYWVHGLTGGAYFSYAFILPALSSSMLWPFGKLTIDRFI